MSKLGSKIVLASCAAAAGAVVALVVGPSVKHAETVEMRKIDRNAVDALMEKARVAAPVRDDEFIAERAPGLGVLEVAHPRFPPSSFRRVPLSRDDIASLDNAADTRVEYDAYSYRRYRPWRDTVVPTPDDTHAALHMRTNNLGLRDDQEVRKLRPDLRILVTGDSHTDGVCSNADSFANLLEATLRRNRPGQVIETLNSGRGGYSFFEYLGALERFLPFQPDVFVVGVYGGNDFYDVLWFERVFHGTKRSADVERSWPPLARATKVNSAAIAQAFLSVRVFNDVPEEVELALQCARDVSTEIVATCLRHGVHPIFVYIPPLNDVEATRHADLLERMRTALELEPEQMHILDRMADSYLAFLRELRVDVVDLRPTFREADKELYWPEDWHIDPEAHRRIAEALVPLVEAARPVESQRVPAAAPRRADARELLSPGAPDEQLLASAREIPSLVDERIPAVAPEDEETAPPRPLGLVVARTLYPFGEQLEFDAQRGARTPAGLDLFVACDEHPAGGWRLVTNTRGLRSTRECEPAPAALRALCTGDSRSLGACAADEAWPALLERALAREHPGERVECWNAQAAGATLQQQMATFEGLRELDLDLFVVTIDGDDDLLSTLRVARALALPRKERAREARSSEAHIDGEKAPAPLATLESLRKQPEDLSAALHVALQVTSQIQELCRAANAQLLVLYVPSAVDVEWSDVALDVAREAERLQLTSTDLRAMDRLATSYLAELRTRGIAVCDARRALRESPRACYWRGRAGLDLDGQRVVADCVQPAVERAFDATRR